MVDDPGAPQARARRVRPTALWAGVLLTTAIVLCFVPLFNLLAFEFAFALGIPVALCAGLTGARVEGPTVWHRWLFATRTAGILAALALVPITLNALRVRNCDWIEGLLFYLLLPGLTVIIAAAWGVLAGQLTRRRRLLFWAILLGSVGWGVARFWLDPPVDAFNPFLGYYPGSIYDEVVPIGDRLLWSRAEDLGWAVAAVACAGLVKARPVLGRRAVVAGLALAGAIGLRMGATAHDVHRDAAHVQQALGAHRATAHLDIYYPKAWSTARVDALATDLEFAYSELATFLAKVPAERPALYLYPSRPAKKRLMGAGRTRIAKPWQRSIHIHSPKVGDAVSIHELAHVFSAELSNSPLHLSMRGPLPHMGLIEGLAVAATWESGRLDPHHWTAAMRAAGVAPKLGQLLSPTGFLSKNSRTAYTLCGSFVRFQHDTEGAAAVEATYRNGHVMPPERLDSLVAAWEAHLDSLPVDERALLEAQARFDRPAIFRKVCAHEIAALRRVAAQAISRNDLAAALKHLDTLLGHVPRDVKARLLRIPVLVGLGRVADARAHAQTIIDDPKAGGVARNRARERMADLAAADGDAGARAAAGETYDALLAQTFNRAIQRRLAVKQAALTHPQGGPVLALLTAPRGTPRSTLNDYVAAGITQAPDWPVAQYLAGRRAINDGEPGEALLRAALTGDLPHPALRFETERLLARVAFDAGQYAAASAAFDALADRSDLDVQSGERDQLRRWARRARFFGAVDAADIDIDQRRSEDAAE